MRTTPPNTYRLRNHGAWSSDDSYGMNGAFNIPLPGRGHRITACCIVSDGVCDDPAFSGWEHVSVHIEEYSKDRLPSWAEMCAVKDVFWNEEEVVIQFHPAKSHYVNNHLCVLHLWKWTGGTFPTPPDVLVGIKELGVIR